MSYIIEVVPNPDGSFNIPLSYQGDKGEKGDAGGTGEKGDQGDPGIVTPELQDLVELAQQARDQALEIMQGENDIVVNLPGGKSFGKYTNGQTIPIAGRTPWQIIVEAATEYVQAVFSNFSITGQPTIVEVGTTISGAKTFAWHLLLNSSAVAGVDIFDNTGAATLLANTANDDLQSVVVTNRLLNANGATQSFRGVAHDSNTGQPDIYSQNFVITARFLRFFGPGPATPANSGQVRSLPVNSFHSEAGSFTLATGNTQKKFIVALPPGITILSAVDQTALNIDLTNQYVLQGTVNVTDAGGTNRAYNLYEMNIAVPYSTNHNHLITTS
jgi:hypothetical protein